MKHGKGGLDAKRPRYHPGLAWEANNLTNEFIDINKIALDNRNGHVGAPLSKRRRGAGPTNGKTPGLFGANSIGGLYDYSNDVQAFNSGIFLAVAIYGLTDFYLNRGHDLKGLQRRLARWPIGLGLMGVAYYAFKP